MCRADTISVEESCRGIVSVLSRAVEVQEVLLGDSIYEVRSWEPTAKRRDNKARAIAAADATSQDTAGGSPTMESMVHTAVTAKCPHARPMSSPASSVSGAGLCPYTPPLSPSPTTGELCPYKAAETLSASSRPSLSTGGAPDGACGAPKGDIYDELSAASVSSEGDGPSCPMGFTPEPVSKATRKKIQALREKLEMITDPDAIERRLLVHRCVFVSYNGEAIPW